MNNIKMIRVSKLLTKMEDFSINYNSEKIYNNST